MSDNDMDKSCIAKLTDEQEKELKRLIEEVTNAAKDMVKDYEINPPVSGSEGTVIVVHENSPILKENSKNGKD